MMIFELIRLVKEHPVLLALIALTWVLGQAITALIGALPTPTKDSSAHYIFWFRAANLFVGNIQRAFHSSLENSPNFEDAVKKYLAQNSKENTP